MGELGAVPDRPDDLKLNCFLAALAVYYLFCTSVIPSLHSCSPFSDRDRGWESPAGSAAHEEVDHAPGSRVDVDRSAALDDAGTCVACLFGAWPRGLSLPAGVSTPVRGESPSGYPVTQSASQLSPTSGSRSSRAHPQPTRPPDPAPPVSSSIAVAKNPRRRASSSQEGGRGVRKERKDATSSV